MDSPVKTSWLAMQLRAIAETNQKPVEKPKFNPHPKGVIWEGSATKAVLLFLKRHHDIYYTHFQICRETGCSGKSVDWALRYLRKTGAIECVPDHVRNSRYLRYAYKNKARNT